MKQSYFKSVVATMLLIIVVIAIALAVYLAKNNVESLAIAGAIIIAVLAFILVLIVICCCGHNAEDTTPMPVSPAITEDKINLWIQNSISRYIPMRVDECAVSSLKIHIEQNFSNMRKSMNKKIEMVNLVILPYLKFLEEMAKEIGKSEKGWTEENVKKFIDCMERITEKLEKETDEEL